MFTHSSGILTHSYMLFSSLRFLPVYIFALLHGATLFAQGNDCSNALVIQNPTDFCSAEAAGSNQNANASSQTTPSCFSTKSHDVWLTFTAVAPEVVVVINGSSSTSGGTLLQPAVALYSGTCPNGLSEIGCRESDFLGGVVELRRSGLTPGVQYYLRVDGINRGTFQYCIRNYFFGGGVSGDCPKAVVLCDKAAFNVQAVAGPGQNDQEMQDASCFFDGSTTTYEQNTTWYVWTAATNGSLTFTLKPNVPGDDLDFVVYRLPNGPGNCAGKVMERCMASGEDGIFPDAACTGPTGLNTTSTDVSEPPGCPIGSDAFLRALNMTAGTTYALVVNNFSSSGNGFQLSWGGTGLFRGPVAGIQDNDPDNKICVGADIVLSDSSAFSGGVINGWNWNFGPGASTATATTAGPHTIRYTTTGTKTITLKIKTANGCEVSVTRQIVVEECCPLNVIPKVAPGCVTSAVTAVLENAVGNVDIRWSNGLTGPSIAGLPPGNYSVTVEDASGCRDSATFVVSTLPPLQATLVKNEDCVSATASLTLLNDNPPLFYQWSNGATTASVSGLTAGLYAVTVTDVKGCEDSVRFNVDLLPPLQPSVVKDEGCLAAAASLSIPNGTLPFLYQWSTGATTATVANLPKGSHSATVTDAKAFTGTVQVNVHLLPPLQAAVVKEEGCLSSQASLSLQNDNPPLLYQWSTGATTASVSALPKGNHSVTVTDAKGCADSVKFQVDLLPPLEATVSKVEGCTSASASVSLQSNNPPLLYQWSTGATTATVSTLPKGSHTVTVTDAKGCADIVSFVVNLLPPVQATATVQPGCPGEGGATATLSIANGTGPFEVDWSNGLDGQTLKGLAAGTYTASIQDAEGCLGTVQVEVKSPILFEVNLSKDTTIVAGGTATLRVSSPFPGFNAVWTGGDQTLNGTTVTVGPKDTTVYYVTATLNNCKIVDSVTVSVEYEVFEMPNAFTPNGDDLNEKFGPVLSGYSLVQLQIWSRWGSLMFDDVAGAWDGTVNGSLQAPSDVYVYRVVVRKKDGTEVVRKGDVTLLR